MDDTSRAICLTMRETGDYSAAPILADALEEGGFRDYDVLRELRAGPPRWRSERLVATLLGGAHAAAVTTLDELAERLGPGDYPGGHGLMTYEKLVEAARSYVETGDDGLGDGSMSWSNESCGVEFGSLFWPAFTLVTGVPGPDDASSFLSCAC